MDDSVLAHWAFAFLFTQVVEIPIYMRGLRVGPVKAFGASAITHPVVWFVIPHLFSAVYHWAARSIGSTPRGTCWPTSTPTAGPCPPPASWVGASSTG